MTDPSVHFGDGGDVKVKFRVCQLQLVCHHQPNAILYTTTKFLKNLAGMGSRDVEP